MAGSVTTGARRGATVTGSGGPAHTPALPGIRVDLSGAEVISVERYQALGVPPVVAEHRIHRCACATVTMARALDEGNAPMQYGKHRDLWSVRPWPGTGQAVLDHAGEDLPGFLDEVRRVLLGAAVTGCWLRFTGSRARPVRGRRRPRSAAYRPGPLPGARRKAGRPGLRRRKEGTTPVRQLVDRLDVPREEVLHHATNRTAPCGNDAAERESRSVQRHQKIPRSPCSDHDAETPCGSGSHLATATRHGKAGLDVLGQMASRSP
jgi:hypothetical protein